MRKPFHFAILLLASFCLQPIVLSVEAVPLSAEEAMHQSLETQMTQEEANLLPKIEILWRAMVMRNTTLQLALEKMAEKTDPKHPHPKTNKWTQDMLRGLVQIGGMGASLVVGNPAPLMGSAMISRAAIPNSMDARLTTITSADLVILAREIESAQTQVLTEYLQYEADQKRLMEAQKDVDDLNTQMFRANGHPDLTTALTTMMDEAQNNLSHAHTSLETSRHVLVISAGEDAVKQVEQLKPVAVSTDTPIPLQPDGSVSRERR